MSENMIMDGVHCCSEESNYIKPTDLAVLRKLEEFQDKKLGFMMHWAPVVQLGICESWDLSDADDTWTGADQFEWIEDKDDFRVKYENLPKTFNPIMFTPKSWAKLAKDCGFKYVLFTTKHHDGFCMWDTQTTDYKITGKDCAFSTHQYADVCKHIFDSFRAEGIDVHAYFSKPDWHSEYYWAPQFREKGEKTSRNVNYDVNENPDLWEKFVAFTHEQMTELLTDYGPIETLWLDGGWVAPSNRGQDIRLGELVEKIRSTTQPGLLVADRTVGGEHENFITPEQSIPKNAILVPWESCITLGGGFSYGYYQEYKTPRQLAHILIDIVAKGGNLALNITPQPNGELPYAGIQALKGLGAFLDVYGEGIYGTRACAPYVKDKYSFTKKANSVYVFYSYDRDEAVKERFAIPFDQNIKSIKLKGVDEALDYNLEDGHIMVTIKHRDLHQEILADMFIIEIINEEM